MSDLDWIEENLDVKPGREEEDQKYCNCPFCKPPDFKHHMGILLSRAMAHCFKCGWHGSLIKLAMEFRQISYVEALQELHRPKKRFVESLMQGDKKLFVDKKEPEQEPEKITLPKESTRLSWNYNLHLKACAYLDGRGISEATARLFQLEYCLIGEYAQRIIIPVRYEGNLVGFTGRTILKNKSIKRYKNPKGVPLGKYLYNFDNAVYSEVVVIVEGPLDAVRMPFSAVALFTNKMSDAQQLLLVRNWKSAIVLLDKTAQAEAEEIRSRLFPYMTPVRVAHLAHSKDPGEASWSEIASALRSSSTFVSV